jgi:NitT/TauT family transport system ATP-binding protein
VLDIRIDGCTIGGTRVLGQVHLTLTRGEAVAVQGPSGVGKTTLLRCILGLETAFTGTIRAPEKLAAVFQEPALLPWRSVLANITLPTGATEDAGRDLLARVGLQGREGHRPLDLSLGQQRRVALARALAAQPDLICLDEPFVSLDPDLAREMVDLVCQLRRDLNLTLLLITHDRAEAQAIADRILTLGGTPAHIVSNAAEPA